MPHYTMRAYFPRICGRDLLHKSQKKLQMAEDQGLAKGWVLILPRFVVREPVT